jgi:hypothetical protein
MRAFPRPVVVLGFALLAGCEAQDHALRPAPQIAFPAETTATAYFGAPVSWSDTVWLEFHAAGLRALSEPPLRGATRARGMSVVRFLWRRSFHPSIAVRVTRSTAGCTIVTTIRENDMYRMPFSNSARAELVRGTALRRDSTTLAHDSCDDLMIRIDTIGLQSSGPFIESRGLDGADWIFERLDARGHAVLVRWSPDCSTDCGAFTAGMAFLRAANALPKGPRELY